MSEDYVFKQTGPDGKEHTFSIDDRGHMLWDGKRFVIDQKLTLNRWVNSAIIAGGAATVIAAIVSVLEYCR